MSITHEGQVVGFSTTEYAYALDGLYVGDIPQTAYVLGMTLKPVKGLMIQAIHKTYDKNYSDWSRELVNMTERMMTQTEVKYGKPWLLKT